MTLNHARAARITSIKKLQAILDKHQNIVEGLVGLRSVRANAAQNSSTNIVNPSYTAGNFVLVLRACDRGHKL